MISRRNKVLLFAAIVICSVVALPLASKYVRRTVLMHRVRRVVTEVEVFQSEHHRLPATLEELGLNEDPIYYRTDNGSNYIVWFGEELGESVTYHSLGKRWVK